MPVYTSGPILNTGSSLPDPLEIRFCNENQAEAANIKWSVFNEENDENGKQRLPAIQQQLILPARSVMTSKVNLTGVPMYRIRFEITGADPVIDIMTSAASDSGGAASDVQQAAVKTATPAVKGELAAGSSEG
ncbi:hypothetical protein ACE3NQ_24730 [Paenibacillus terreus]|uniref:Uncharacterized protein n=1 Tax=Paenibacillus terreus TaxID=1387834 RepID=A0ABV5BEJ0_9BACL